MTPVYSPPGLDNSPPAALSFVAKTALSVDPPPRLRPSVTHSNFHLRAQIGRGAASGRTACGGDLKDVVWERVHDF
jgi:hypothetical protein